VVIIHRANLERWGIYQQASAGQSRGRKRGGLTTPLFDAPHLGLGGARNRFELIAGRHAQMHGAIECHRVEGVTERLHRSGLGNSDSGDSTEDGADRRLRKAMDHRVIEQEGRIATIG
jgi:hypothetical protein